MAVWGAAEAGGELRSHGAVAGREGRGGGPASGNGSYDGKEETESRGAEISRPPTWNAGPHVLTRSGVWRRHCDVTRDKLDSGFFGSHRAGAVRPPRCRDGCGPWGPCRQTSLQSRETPSPGVLGWGRYRPKQVRWRVWWKPGPGRLRRRAAQEEKTRKASKRWLEIWRFRGD